MAIVNYIGFEQNTLVELYGSGGTAPTLSTTVHTLNTKSGLKSLSCAATTTGTSYGYISALNTDGAHYNALPNTFYLTFWFDAITKPATADKEEEILYILGSGSTAIMRVRLRNDGKLSAYDKDLNLVGTSTSALTEATWYRIDVKVVGKVNPASCVVKINGTQEIAGSLGTGLGSITNQRIYLGKTYDKDGQTVSYLYDDVIIRDDDYSVDAVIINKYPTGDSATNTGFTATAGSKFQCIDEPPDAYAAASYVYSAVADACYTATLVANATVGLAAGTIIAVKAQGIIVYIESTASLKIAIQSGATLQLTTDSNTYTGPALVSLIAAVDPNTTLAWTLTNLEAVEIGLKNTGADTKTTRMSAAGLSVLFAPDVVAGGGNITYFEGMTGGTDDFSAGISG